MFILYDIIFLIFAVIYLPVLLLKGKGHGGFAMRFGDFSRPIRNNIAAGRNIWVHAVSVGEVISVTGMVRELKKMFPGHQIVVSVVTQTGHALAVKRLADSAIVIWAPLDFSWVVRRFVALIRPVIYVNAETELWPNLLTALARQKVPIVEVNGRISDRSFPRYRMVRAFMRGPLRKVSLFCMQSTRDAERIITLGADPARVQVTGNIKFDDLPGETRVRAADFGLRDTDDIWIAGSTHPGEETIVLEIFKALRARFPKLRLVIAPRHAERAAEVARLVRESGFAAVLFSERSMAGPDGAAVMVVDTIGHLRSLYAVATLVFVGKSLTVHGGHNIIEPAFYGKPVIVGPYMENFRDIVDIFLAQQAVIQVAGAKDLQDEVARLLAGPEERTRLGQRAREVVGQNRGATRKMLQSIGEFIRKP